MSPDAALVACRFLHAASLMLVWGGSAYLAWLVPAGLAGIVARRLRWPALAAVGIAVVTGAVFLPIETAGIGAGWADALDPGTVQSVLFDTTVGRAWQVQTIAALLLLASIFLRQRRLGALAVTSGLCLAGLALSGHAVMQNGAPGVAHIANHAVHLLAGGAWLGALFPLLPCLSALRDPALRKPAGEALRRFSRAGHVAVALVIATGIANTALVLGRWPLDWASPYQALLAAKIALVAVMTAIALTNRYLLVPRIRADRERVLATLTAMIVVEIGLGAAVLALVALFGTMDPV